MRPYSPVRRMNQQTKRPRLAGLVFFCILVFHLFAAYRRYPASHSCGSPYARVYDVAIDAGSTGSRVYIFQFERAKDGVALLTERFRCVGPGLSSYALDPAGARRSEQGLLGLAVEVALPSYYACAAVALRATAGLRLLPGDQQRFVLDAAGATLAASPFVSRGASIISGAQEGVYGWLAVNYLLGNVNSDRAAVIIDMGGASAQVVFGMPQAAGEWLPFSYAHQLRTPTRTIVLYQHGCLGLGLNVAKRAATVGLARANGTQSFPCFPTNHQVIVDGTELRNSDAADFGLCAEVFRQHVVKRPVCRFDGCGAHGVPQPSLLAKSSAIYAFSFYYDRLHRFQGDEDPVFVSSFRERGKEACRLDSQERRIATEETICMDMAYLYSFLSQGLGLDDAAPLLVPNRIEAKAVSWSLGASLSHVLEME